jgi:hypothetical protein
MTPSQVIDVTPGLWLWRLPHPDWEPGAGGDRRVTSTCAESGGEVAVIDPLAPPDPDDTVWERLDSRPPTMAVVLKPDHVRSVDYFVTRYGARGYGPDVFNKDDIPETDLELVLPGYELPGGMIALYDGRGRNETPLWLPQHRTIVFSDALTSLGGELQVWTTPWHEERVLPALRDLLQYPFEWVVVSHGQPLHSRAEFAAALEREPYSASP